MAQMHAGFARSGREFCEPRTLDPAGVLADSRLDSRARRQQRRALHSIHPRRLFLDRARSLAFGLLALGAVLTPLARGGQDEPSPGPLGLFTDHADIGQVQSAGSVNFDAALHGDGLTSLP